MITLNRSQAPGANHASIVCNLIWNSSGTAQMQQTDAIAAAKGTSHDFARAEEQLARRSEALISNKPGGMG